MPMLHPIRMGSPDRQPSILATLPVVPQPSAPLSVCIQYLDMTVTHNMTKPRKQKGNTTWCMVHRSNSQCEDPVPN